MKYLVRVLEFLNEDFEDLPLFKNLLIYLSYQSTGEYQEVLVDKFDISFNMNIIRKNYRSLNFGYDLPFVFLPLIYEKGSIVEYDSFIDNSKIYEKLKSNREYLLLLNGVGSIPKKSRSLVVSSFDQVFNSNETFDSFISFILKNNSNFQQFLKSHSQKKYGVLIREKRRFFRKQISNKKNLLYSFIGLFSLGDFNEENIAGYLNYVR